MAKIFTRMGDGYRTEMEPDEMKEQIEAGSIDAADRGKIGPLSENELEQLYDICSMPAKVVSVERGNEVVVTIDGGTNKVFRLGIPAGRVTRIQIHERAFGADTMELAHIDYSFKAIKPIVHEEQGEMEQALLSTVLPLFYGAMPNLGLYYQPDGPVPNAAELMPAGKIKEAQEAQEEAIEMAVKDMVYVGSRLYESGADGINFDTTGAAGDTDVKATLIAVEALKEKYPEMGVELGMAGEFVLGMHGELYHDETRLAGLYPHKQVKLAEKAGANIFGVAINTDSGKSFPWNLARAVTYCKACVESAGIPVHANVGMGVGGVPLSDINPVDSISRVSKAMAEVGKLDGL